MVRAFFAAHLGLLYELSGAFAAFGLVIVVAGVLVSRFDKIPVGDAIYFAFITAFTVGFGDVAPKSHGARVVAVVLSFLGLILLGILVAVAVHSLDLALQVARGV
jgi:voltage-gated potassium channel